MDELTPEDLEFFRELLTNQLNDLLETANRTVSDMFHRVEDGTPADPLDRAVLDSDRNYTLRIRDRESRLIGKIKSALAKIDEGFYGICEACDQPISPARLKARPTTDYCINCKTQMEMYEKAAGL